MIIRVGGGLGRLAGGLLGGSFTRCFCGRFGKSADGGRWAKGILLRGGAAQENKDGNSNDEAEENKYEEKKPRMGMTKLLVFIHGYII